MVRLIAVALLMLLAGCDDFTPEQKREMVIYNSHAYTGTEDCMSGSRLKSNAMSVDWTEISGSAEWNDVQKLYVGKMLVYRDMYQLGVKPCKDVKPGYDAFVKKVRS